MAPPPPVVARPTAQVLAPEPQLLAWCKHEGARSVAAWRSGPGGMARLDAAMQWLDGSVALAACGGRFAGWRFRLRLKAREFLQAQAHPDDPWDAGWLQPGPAALARLAVFQPRRHTLVVVPAAQVAEVLDWLSLQPATPGEAMPAGRSALRVRLLLVCAGDAPGPVAVESALQSQRWGPLAAGLWLE